MKIEKSWAIELKEELTLPYIQELKSFLEHEKKEGLEIYPREDLIFSAFFETPFHEVKVVIVGQDPYHGPGQAHGLSFSVPPGIAIPPSLKNIFKELESDLQISIASTGCLLSWAKQGVFLLNSSLTVRAGEPGSHRKKGWERFTDAVIDKLLTRQDPIVFLLWGKAAQEKGERILASNIHKVFTAAHPSPYSVKGFKGCCHFSKTNKYLELNGKKSVDWNLPS